MTTPQELQEAFHQCMPLFIALGDEVRLTIIEALASPQPLGQHGLNVNQITEKTSLSRPAISHHLKILKEAGLVSVQETSRPQSPVRNQSPGIRLQIPDMRREEPYT